MNSENSNIEFGKLREELGISNKKNDVQRSAPKEVINSSDTTPENESKNAINENEEEIDIFANTDDVIIVTDVEVIPEYERIYKDDTIYIEDLETEFLSELSIEDQNSKYHQQKISEKVQNIIELKNEGQKILNRDHTYSSILDNYFKNDFSSHWLIPVVLDKQKIYITIDPDNPTLSSEDVKNDKNDTVEKNLRDEFQVYSNLYEEFKYKKIGYDKYSRESAQLFRPYILSEKLNNSDIGYKTKLNYDTNLLRYHDIDTTHWKERIGTGPVHIASDILDDKQKIIRTQRKILIPGEEINIVGFFLLSKNSNSLTDIVSMGLNKFDKIGDIEKIIVGEKTVIVSKNHDLETGDYIVIKGNDQIDGTFKISVIDDDKFTINYNTIRLDIENTGEIYGNKKLKYNTINLKKNKDVFQLDGNFDNDKSNLYLFDSFKLTENEFNEVLKLVVPKLSDIIKIQHIELEKAKFMKDVDLILSKYKTNYNDINIEQLDVIKKLLEKHVKIETSQIDEYQKTYNKIITEDRTEKKDFPNTIYRNEYLYADEIVKLYGEYPLRDNIFDSLEQRLGWIDNHIDFGNYYYNFVLSKESIYNKSEIEATLKNVSQANNIFKNSYEKEKKLDKYFDKCSKFVKEYNDLNELEKDNAEYDIGSMAILVSEKRKNKYDKEVYIKLDNAKIYERTKEGWVYREEAEDDDTIIYMCGLEDEKIKDMTDINCVYTLEGCKSKRLYKIERNVKMTDNAVENYRDLLEQIKNMDSVVKDKLSKNKNILEQKNIDKIILEETVPEELNSKIPISIVQILGRITKVKNEYARRHLMYQLLEKDGLEIGDIIYSKKYQGYLMCGHYAYLKREEYTNDNSIKDMIREKMLSRFGDNGKSINGQQSCKICGAYLSDVPYDDTPSFDQYGAPIIMRDEIVDEEKKIALEREKDLDNIICGSQVYRTELISKGFKLEQLDDGIKICTIMQSIMNKIGIKILKSDFMDIVVDSLEQLSILPSYPVFRKKTILMYRGKGVPDHKISKLDESGIFKISYSKFITVKKYSLIAARMLISIQTSVPPYIRKKPLSGCTFSSWKGKYGVEYLACILQEMKVMVYKDATDKMKDVPISEIVDDIFKFIRVYSDKVSIKKKYGQRSLFDKSQPVKSERKIDISDKIVSEVDELSNNFKTQVLTGQDVAELYHQLYSRMQFLMYSIKRLMQDGMKDEEYVITVPIDPPFNVNACCIDLIENYRYSKFIDDKSDGKLSKLMKETWDMLTYFELFVYKGTITKMFVKADRKIYAYNQSYESILTEGIIKKKFEMYCYEGITKGEVHNMIKMVDGDKKCVKCGKTLKDIQQMKFDKDNFAKLLENIVDKLYIIPKSDNIEELIDLNSLQVNELSGEIETFIDKLANITGNNKSVEFKNKYKNLLNSLGNYENTYNIDNISDDNQYKIVKLVDNRVENRIYLLKTYINQYFRRYVSTISNNFNIRDEKVRIPTVTSKISQELQKFIYDEYDPIAQYITETNSRIFKSLQFQYSSREINSINAKSDRYNCTWDNVVETSKFNLNNAADVLLYILITQLNNFLLSVEKDEVIIIANFIITIFETIMSDTEIFDMNYTEIEKYSTTIYYQEYCHKSKELAESGTEANTKFMKDQFGIVHDGEIDIRSLIEEDEKMSADNYKQDLADVEIENLARTKIGADATDEQLEAFKEDYKRTKEQDEFINSDQFDMQQPMEGEILEVGDDYGEMPQGTENEGDGIYNQED